jgi:hypothetical protein
MTGLEERVADQLNEKALDAAADVAYTHHELWARTSGSPTDLAIRSIISAYLSALESQGLKIVPVEPTEDMLHAMGQAANFHMPADANRAIVYAAMLNAVQEG